MRMFAFYGKFTLRPFVIMYPSSGDLTTCSNRCHICKKIIDTVSISKAVTAVDRQYIQAELRVDVFKAVCKMTQLLYEHSSSKMPRSDECKNRKRHELSSICAF